MNEFLRGPEDLVIDIEYIRSLRMGGTVQRAADRVRDDRRDVVLACKGVVKNWAEELYEGPKHAFYELYRLLDEVLDDPSVTPHTDSGARCLVIHIDGIQCIRCATCRDWIHPHFMGDECPGNERATL